MATYAGLTLTLTSATNEARPGMDTHTSGPHKMVAHVRCV